MLFVIAPQNYICQYVPKQISKNKTIIWYDTNVVNIWLILGTQTTRLWFK